MRERRSMWSALAAVSLLPTAAMAQPILREARFDADTQGWSVLRLSNECTTPLNAIAGTVTFQAAGGNPGGQLQHVPPSEGRVSYWSAPASFLGDLSEAEGGVLSFDSRQSGSVGGAAVRVILSGGKHTLIYSGTQAPRSLWRRFHVLLGAGGGWKVGSCTGPDATPEIMAAVLANVTQLLIHSEYGTAATNDGLDNVAITGLAPASPTSTFDADLEGWWIYYDANYPTWNSTGGNPDGCMHVVDRVEGECWRFVAPAKFLGDHREALGGTLRFDMKAPGERACSELSFVQLIGGGLTLDFDLESLSGSKIWRAYTVPLAPSPAWTRSSDGATPTIEDFERVLAAVNSLSIRGEFVSGNDNAYFDNVAMGSCEPSVVAWADSTPCVNENLSVRSFVGGTAPFTYQWRRDGQPINPKTNPSAQSAMLVLGRAALNDVGTYDVQVTNSCGTEISNPVEIHLCVADFNCDGVVNSQDFFDFLTAYFDVTPRSDFNGDGRTNSQDFFDFLAVFFEGCR